MGTTDVCPKCGRGPFRLTHLYDHLRRVHNWNEAQIDHERAKYKVRRFSEMDEFKCDICHKVYHSHGSWKRHREFVHKTDRTIEGPYVVCPGCQQKFPNNSELAKHWIDEHNGQEDVPGPSGSGFLPMLISTLNSSQRKVEIIDSKSEVAQETSFTESASVTSMEDEDDDEEDVMSEGRETRSKTKEKKELDEAERIVQAIKKAEYIRLKRLNETDEERARRLAAEAERARRKRAKETYEERAARLRKNADRARMKRLIGTQEKIVRMKLEAERNKFKRAEHKQNTGADSAEGSICMDPPRTGCQAIPHPTSPQLYSTAESDMPTLRDLVAWKEAISSMRRSNAICYAVVGIRTVALRTMFRNLMERFQFNDLVFISNPAVSHASGTNDMDGSGATSTSDTYSQREASVRFDNDDLFADTKAGGICQSESSKASHSEQAGSKSTTNGHKGDANEDRAAKGREPPCKGDAINNREELSTAFQPETSSTRSESVQLQSVPPIITTMQTSTSRFQIIQLQQVPSRNGNAQRFQLRNENIQLGSPRVVQVQPCTSNTLRGENNQASRKEAAQPCTGSNGSVQQCSAKSDNLGRNYCCLICNVSRSGHEIRHTSYKRQQNIVLLACLQAQNIIDMDVAKGVYKEILRARKRICHDHYMQAAAFIGKEVEDMWGKFPEHGIDEVPCNVREDLLAYVQVYGEYLDEAVTLNCDDIARFFYECLMKYYNISNGWSVNDMHIDSIRKEEDSMPAEDQVKIVEPCSSNDSSLDEAPNTVIKSDEDAQNVLVLPGNNDPPLFKETKEEPVDSEEISAMDLMGPETVPPRAPVNPSSLVLVGTASVDSEGALSVHLDDPEQRDTNVVGLCSTNPTRVFRDNSNCLDTLDDKQFRNRFRMTRKTFLMLCNTLDPMLKSKKQRAGTCATGIKVGMALEILAGNNFTFAGGSVMQSGATRILTEVLETLLEWSSTMIQWPDERDSKRISDSFFEMTGLTDIVGCIDGTIVSGLQNINVGLVADDKKRFRWVFAKFRSDTDDELVFKRSLLCKQLREGIKKGRLIGDDAYNCEMFLLTPNERKAEMTGEDFALAATLRKTHTLVEQAIADWKRQFPILNADIRSSRTARIIVSCAALYNLTRTEGEPPFCNEEESLFKVEPADNQSATVS